MTRIDRAALDRHFPQVTYETGLFMIDYLRRLNGEFENDITSAIVLGEIAQHSVRDLMKRDLPRSGKAAREFVTRERVKAGLKRCNALSVAQSSGIPRETVRRKVAKLEQLGLVSRDAAGGLAVTRKVGRQFKEFDRETLAGLVDLAERVRGVLGRR